MNGEFAFNESPQQSLREEIANSISHGLGLVFSLVGVPILVWSGWNTATPTQWIGAALYISTLIAVYAASTLSHAVQHPQWKQRFRAWDQAAIYLLIAGTYTPYMLQYIDPATTVYSGPLVWGFAVLGCCSKLFWRWRVESVSTLGYVLLGWLPAMALIEAVPADCRFWLVGGGIAYSVGTLFLKFDQRVPFFHTTWHALVLTGSGMHFVGVARYTLGG